MDRTGTHNLAAYLAEKNRVAPWVSTEKDEEMLAACIASNIVTPGALVRAGNGAYCPECANYVEMNDEGAHLYLMVGETLVVVVGCQGYHVVDPNLVGIPTPGWSNANGE